MNKKRLSLLLAGLLACGMMMAQAQDSVHINLEKAIEIALSEAPTMRIADRSVDIKREYKKEHIVSLFPDVSLASNYNRTLLKQKLKIRLLILQKKLKWPQKTPLLMPLQKKRLPTKSLSEFNENTRPSYRRL